MSYTNHMSSGVPVVWLSGKEPWGCGFDPCPHSVGQVSSIAVSCGIGHRHGLDATLLWLWHRPSAAAPVRPLAWDLGIFICHRCIPNKQKKRKKKGKKNHMSSTTVWEINVLGEKTFTTKIKCKLYVKTLYYKNKQKLQLKRFERSERGVLMPCKDSRTQKEEKRFVSFPSRLNQWEAMNFLFTIALPSSFPLYKE